MVVSLVPRVPDRVCTALCEDTVCRICRICPEPTATRGADEGGSCFRAEGMCAGEWGRTLVGDCAACPTGTGVCTRLDQFAFACLPLCGDAIS